MSEKIFNQIPEDEISLKDIIDFLIESWKLIFVTGLLGVLASIGYLLVTPNQYQAIAQIQVAQVSTGSIANPLGVNIEDPNLLIARLKLPSTYSAEAIKACGFENVSNSAESLAAITKFSAVKGIGSMIELKINRYSKEAAIVCAQALYENIKISQNEIIKPYVEEYKILLAKYQQNLINSQSLVARADKLGSGLSAAYLANRDEVRFLTEDILRLNTFIMIAEIRQAKLASPIYVADAPILPKKKNSLIIGLMAGLFLGLLFVIGKKTFKTYKAA